MKLSKKAENQIRKIVEYEAVGHYVCNRDDDDFPKNPLELLWSGRFENTNGKQIVIWQPYENEEPEQIAEHIEDTMSVYMDMARRCVEVALGSIKNEEHKTK